MGCALVVQPNGLLARFTTFFDDFTDMDLTAEDAIELYRTMNYSTDGVAAKVERALAAPERWRELLGKVRALRGRARYEIVKARGEFDLGLVAITTTRSARRRNPSSAPSSSRCQR